MSDRPSARLCTTDHNPLRSGTQLALSPSHSSPFQTTFLFLFAYEDLMRDSFEGLAEVKVDNIHSSLFICPGSCFVMGGNNVGQTFSEWKLITLDHLVCRDVSDWIKIFVFIWTLNFWWFHFIFQRTSVTRSIKNRLFITKFCFSLFFVFPSLLYKTKKQTKTKTKKPQQTSK